MLPVKTSRTYSHYCGVAHALDLVGERWGLLVVRELLLGPRRFTDLCRGLPGIGTNILTARLKELESGGVVRRRRLPPPAATAVYELTDYGRELEGIVLALGRWGAKSMDRRSADQHLMPASLMLAMQANFRSETAQDVHIACEFRLGDEIFSARIADGRAQFSAGASEQPDVVVETDPDSLIALLAGAVTADEAAAAGSASIDGDPADVSRMLELFRFPLPEPERARAT